MSMREETIFVASNAFCAASLYANAAADSNNIICTNAGPLSIKFFWAIANESVFPSASPNVLLYSSNAVFWLIVPSFASLNVSFNEPLIKRSYSPDIVFNMSKLINNYLPEFQQQILQKIQSRVNIINAQLNTC